MTKKTTVFLLSGLFAMASVVAQAAEGDELPVVVKGGELSAKAKEQLSRNLMSTDEFQRLPLIDPMTGKLRPVLTKQFEAILPQTSGDGRPFHYIPVCATIDEFEEIAKGELTPKAMKELVRRSPDAAVALVAKSGVADRKFLPVLVQVRAGDEVTGLAVFNKNGTVANALASDPGSVSGGAIVGTPLLRLTEADAPQIDPMRSNLTAASEGRFGSLNEFGVPVTRYRIVKGEIAVRSLAPFPGEAPILLKPGSDTIAFVRTGNGGLDVEKEANPSLNVHGLTGGYRTAVAVLEGSVILHADTFIGAVVLSAAGNNFFGQTAGGKNVFVSDLELNDRDENSESLFEDAADHMEDGVDEDLDAEEPDKEAIEVGQPTDDSADSDEDDE